MENLNKRSIIDMARGAIKERADYEMTRVVENILDPNTSATAARKITITLMGAAQAPCGGAEPASARVGRSCGSMYYRFAPRASARAPAGFLRPPQGRLTTKARRIMKRSPAKATPMTNKF